MEKKSCEILCVGTEILLGDIVNTNAQYISRGLSQLGIDVYYETVVGDNPARLEEALNIAKTRADIIITTGGLGPTYDDLTKETISRNFGRELEMNQKCLEELTAFFVKGNRIMTENNKKQAMMPKGCIILDNPQGTAPGCIIEGDDGKTAIMMPGPPREMKPMFDNHVRPYLRQFSEDIMVSRVIRVISLGESAMEDRLRDMMESMTNPTIAPYAKDSECLVRITAKAKSEQEAYDMMEPVIEEIQQKLGIYAYGVDVDSLEEHIVQLLTEHGKTVAFAESCTGGLAAKRLTDVPGSSAVFRTGIVAYSNGTKRNVLGVRSSTLKKWGAVSHQTAVEMALGVYNLSGADIGVGITGIAGPDGGTEEKPVGLVYVAATDGVRTWVKKLYVPRSREYIRISAVNNAYDMVRRFVIRDAEALEQRDREFNAR